MTILSAFTILFETDSKVAAKETDELANALDNVEKSAGEATGSVDDATKAYNENSVSAGALAQGVEDLSIALEHVENATESITESIDGATSAYDDSLASASELKEEIEGLSDGLDDVDKGAGDAAGSVDETTKSYDSNSESAGALTKSMFGLVAAFVTFDAIASKVFNAAGSVDDVGKFSQRLGLDVVEIDAWGEAAIRNGGSAEAFRGTVDSLQNSLQRISIDGGGEIINTLAQLGIQATDSKGNIKDVLDVLNEVGEAFQRRGPEQSNTYGQSLGIDAGTILTLQQTRHQLDQLVARQKTLSTITAEATKKAADFNDTWADTKLIFNSTWVTGNNTILPILTSIVSKLNSAALWVKENKTLVEGFFIGVAGVITAMYLPAIAMAAVATLIAVAPFVILAAKIGLAAAGIALLYEDIKAWTNGSKSAIGELINVFDGLKDKISSALDGAFESITEQWGEFMAMLDGTSSKIADFFGFSGDVDVNGQASGSSASSSAAAMETINSYSATNLNHGGSTVNQRTQTNNVTVGGSTVDARGMTGSEAKSAISAGMKESVADALGQLADGVER